MVEPGSGDPKQGIYQKRATGGDPFSDIRPAGFEPAAYGFKFVPISRLLRLSLHPIPKNVGGGRLVCTPIPLIWALARDCLQLFPGKVSPNLTAYIRNVSIATPSFF